MFDFFSYLSPIMQSLISTIFTWFMTMLGASVVFFFKDLKNKLLNLLLGFSAGIMLAATFWSLLNPALILSNKLKLFSSFVICIGILCGSLLIFLGNCMCLKISKKNINRSFLVIFSITLHNIPEGLVIGVAFGSLCNSNINSGLISAMILALGIGLQNFPEGSAISIPLRKDGYSNKKAFFIGQLSGIVEPISAVIGAALSTTFNLLLPFLLSFAAGAMLYVIFLEIIPESQASMNKNLVTLFSILGFIFMTLLDILF